MHISQFKAVVTIAFQFSVVSIGSEAFDTRMALTPAFGSSCWNQQCRRCSSFSKLCLSSEDNNSPLSDSDEPEDDFYRALRKAKAQKLGADIPPEQLKDSAREAENEFLQAMKETTKDFKEAKDKLGSQGAVDLFLGRIRKEDEQRVYDEEEEEPFQ